MILPWFVLASLLAAVGPTLSLEERAIIKAAVAFAHIEPLPQTLLPGAMPFPMLLLRDQPIAQWLGTREVFSISSELIDGLQEANGQRLSLRGVVRTNRTPNTPAVSRPGISRDGTKAIIVIENSDGFRVPYLEKRDGDWRVVAMGPVGVF